MDNPNRGPFLWIYPVLLIPALGMVGWGLVLAFRTPADRVLLAAGCLAVLVVVVSWLMTVILSASRALAGTQLQAAVEPLAQQVQQVSALLKQISDQQLISERAKAIAFRENEREALRRAIREEMGRKAWDAALMLANEIESVFGYKQEADQFRGEIQVQREAETRRNVEEGMALVDRHCRGEQWSDAVREAHRLAKAYPVDLQAQRLPQDVENRREAFKQQLVRNWNEAVGRRDIDGSIELLHQLDPYLTPDEAQSMQETARQVFKDKLLLLGQQFTLAVKEHRWADAIRLGETIASEFPNSRMAQEVREKMDLLKQRAAEPAEAKA